MSSCGRIVLSIFISCLNSIAFAIGQTPSISFTPSSGAVLLASRNTSVQLFLDRTEWPGVIRAARDLAFDFGRVTGTNGTVHLVDLRGNQSPLLPRPVPGVANSGGTIVIGTLGRVFSDSSVCDGTASNRTRIINEWETYCSKVDSTSNVLFIAGSDKRGTIYGLYDISEQIGVSPWYFFADVPTQQREVVYALNIRKKEGPPSIKYRGIFINDEAPALTGWVNEHFPKSQYGSAFGSGFYAHVFELLLRLRANYLWPAMWGSMFNVDDPQNQKLADEFGIVSGTSHTEPMMRATREQNLFVSGPWQWNVNNDSMRRFMLEGAERARSYESVFTLGARGNHDTAINGGDAINQLNSIIQAQKKILDDVYGDNGKIPQVITLYTEVLSYYDNDGLKIPDDITLLFTDDNYGNIRRLPYGNETGRRGGAGVYYINTIQLQRTWEQMSLAYERNASRIWVVNVGDIKPLEIPMSHFLDMAWDMRCFQETTSSMWWLTQWARREFGPSHSDEIAEMAMSYSNLAGRRKFEAVQPETYSILHYNEAERILEQWQMLRQRAEGIYRALSVESQAAFFQLLLHPILAAGNHYELVIYAAKNKMYASQGRNSANAMANLVLERWKMDHELAQRYHGLLGGKWDHLMDTPHLYHNYWQQPMRQNTPPVQFIDVTERSLSGDMGVAIEGSYASIPGDDAFHTNSGEFLTLPAATPFSPERQFEVYAQGMQNFTFDIQAEPFVRLSQREGAIYPRNNGSDIRISVGIEWNKVPTATGVTRINISSSTNYGTQYAAPYLLLPFYNQQVPRSFTVGFVEGETTIAMEAEHFTRMTQGASSLTYTRLPDFGKTMSGMSLSDRNAQALIVSTAPCLEYDFFTFTQTSLEKPAIVSVILAPSLNINPQNPLRYAIAVDGSKPKIVTYVVEKSREANQTGRPSGMPHGWERAVLDNVWDSRSNFTIPPGNHTLRFWALEAGAVATKFIIYLADEVESYFGPPESFKLGGPK